MRRRLARLATWRGAVILNYHRIGSPAGEPWNQDLWNATTEAFDAHVAFLKRNADVVSVADLPALAASRRGRHVLLTFDDGYRDNYECAFPVLRRHGVTATFFLTTGFLDHRHAAWWDEIAWMVRHADPARRAAYAPGDDATAIVTLVERYKALPADCTEAYLDEIATACGSGRCNPDAARDVWMTWDMAREMRDAGMTLGGHTVTHPVLARLDEQHQREEIDGCARRLHEELGEPMRWFAYPVGAADAFDRRTRAALAAAGVRLAFSFYGGAARFARWDPFDVQRIHVGPWMRPRHLAAISWLPGRYAPLDRPKVS